MLMPINEIHHQKQPIPNSCYATCIAMAVGIPVGFVLERIERAGKKLPLSNSVGFAYFVKEGIYPEKVDHSINTIFLPERVYFLGVIGLKYGQPHGILTYISDEKYYVFDPAEETLTHYVNNDFPYHITEAILLHNCSSLECK